MENNYKEKVNKSAVKAMGFSDKLIEMLLPEPELFPNPRYKSAAPTQKWLRSDVEKAMKTKEFQEYQEKRKKRQAASQRAVETKKDNLKKQAEEELKSVTVERIDIDVLEDLTRYLRYVFYSNNDYLDINAYYAYTADIDTVNRCQYGEPASE